MLNLSIMIFLMLSIMFIYSVLSIIFIKPKSISRIEKYFSPHKDYDIQDKDSSNISINPRVILNSIGENIGKLVLMKKHLQKLQVLLIKSGIPLKSEEFIALQFIISAILFILNYFLIEMIGISLFMSLIGYYIPILIVNIAKTKRYKLFNEQLSDSITLISNSLKAGHSFFQSIDSVAKEMPEPISKEFEKVLKEIRLGVLTEDALENLLSRVESEDLELMITAVLIQRQIGGNLSEILDNISKTIRERIKLKGEIRALTAQGRLSGIIVSLLPVALGVILYLINTEYMMELFNSPYGILMIIAAAFNEVIGIIMINKIVKIEV